jgi:hypothetical protein
MPGARYLQHHGGQAMTNEVVDVTSDPTALGQQRLVGQLTPRPLELDDEPFLASDRTTEDRCEHDGHDPDADADLHWILHHGHQHWRPRGERTDRRRRRERPRPTRGREREETGIEHDGLELSGALHHDYWNDDRDRDCGERHTAESPQAPSGDRHRRKGEVGCG